MPSFVQKTVPHLKDMFMANASHQNFGKYTLFSRYGITANANMSPVAFATLFGNESGYAWKQFWDSLGMSLVMLGSSFGSSLFRFIYV